MLKSTNLLTIRCLTIFIYSLLLAGCNNGTKNTSKVSRPTTQFIPILLGEDPARINDTLRFMDENWRQGYAIVLVEISPYALPATSDKIEVLLNRKIGHAYPPGDKRWLQAIWGSNFDLVEDYADFKSDLYSRLRDPRFAEYFDSNYEATIRLDQVQHGGVDRDGIPPLEDPNILSAETADYLNDDDIVFGVSLNEESRAYPKRIMGWHEMVKDKVGGVSINGVYCTLCGSMIVYDTMLEGAHYELGTSGFLYRSNKLMYDHETKSLWSTLRGEPVVGPLVGKKIQLKKLSVITTTWANWKTLHPDTTVLDINTGFKRNYDEGAAYRDYFSHDELMFDVPLKDSRLANKEPVLALRFGAPEKQLAITSHFLIDHPVYHAELAGTRFVVFTDNVGGSRVYQNDATQFTSFDGVDRAIDSDGNTWNLAEDYLTGPNQKRLNRLPSHNAFWFGWYAAFPDTTLVFKE